MFCELTLLHAQWEIIHQWFSVWPDWAIYSTLCKFLKPLAIINLPKSPTFLGIFIKVSKYVTFQMKSFWGNFYSHLAIFSGHTATLTPPEIKLYFRDTVYDNFFERIKRQLSCKCKIERFFMSGFFVFQFEN